MDQVSGTILDVLPFYTPQSVLTSMSYWFHNQPRSRAMLKIPIMEIASSLNANNH
jgi:hypothetical protein